jgi:hypothetical protein
MLIGRSLIRTKRNRWKARKPGVMISGRRFSGDRLCITWFPGDFEEVPDVQAWFEHHAHYSIAGMESCPRTGRRHLHIYAEFWAASEYERMQALDPSFHVEKRGVRNEKQAITYVTKGDEIVWEFGERHVAAIVRDPPT